MKRIILIMAVLVAGCTGPVSQTSDGVVSNGSSNGSVSIVNLKDGTKCAVLIGYYKGAISCDWKS
jgi:hypothetical protein